MYKLREASEVPRIGAQPPPVFQLPSVVWFFSIFATHFCSPLRILAFNLGNVPSTWASNIEATNVSMNGPSFLSTCVCCLASVIDSPSAGLASTLWRMKPTARSTFGRYWLPALSSASAAIAVLPTSFPFDSRGTFFLTYEASPASCPHPPSPPWTEASHLAPLSMARSAGLGVAEVFRAPVVCCVAEDFGPSRALFCELLF